MQASQFDIAELTQQSPVIDKLTVLSYEMSVYFVRLNISQCEGLVYRDKQPMRFYSAGQIREVFAHCKVLKAEMHHASPYDEMIGNPDSAQHASTLPFSMQQAY